MFIKVMTILILYYTLVKGGGGEGGKGGGGGGGGGGPPKSIESEDYVDYDDAEGPQYCTKIHKVISAAMKPGPYYKLVQPTNYIIPRQLQVFQLLWCIEPESLEYIVKVCDWLEAPEVDISIHETHLVVLRKDNGVKKFLGYAVMNITQRCTHGASYAYHQSAPTMRYDARVSNFELNPYDETLERHRKKWHKEQSLKRTDTGHYGGRVPKY